jgi:hypothetical protein
MCYAALRQALHLPKENSYLQMQQGRQTGLYSENAAIPIGLPLNSVKEFQ